MSFKKKNLEKILGTAIGLILLVMLLTQISFGEVAEALLKVSWPYLVLIFMMTFLVYLLRALRFYLLLMRSVHFWRLFLIVCTHNLANNVLPARSGELSYIYLVKKHSSLKPAYITSTLLIARFLDLFAITIAFPLLLLLLGQVSPMLAQVRNIVILFFFVMMILAMMVYWKHEAVVRRLEEKEHANRYKKKAAVFIVQGLEVVSMLKKQPVVFTITCIVTVLIWLDAFLSTYVLAYAIGIPLPFVGIAVGTTFVVITSILPINSFFGVGVYEGSWTAAMMAQGIAKEVAISSGVAMHIIRIVTYLLFGFIGLYIFTRGRQPDRVKGLEIDQE